MDASSWKPDERKSGHELNVFLRRAVEQACVAAAPTYLLAHVLEEARRIAPTLPLWHTRLRHGEVGRN